MHSDFLFAHPSRLAGLARLLDLFGTFDDYNVSRTRPIADARAMYADWVMTGQDIRNAIAVLEAKKRQDLRDAGQGELFPATAG